MIASHAWLYAEGRLAPDYMQAASRRPSAAPVRSGRRLDALRRRGLS